MKYIKHVIVPVFIGGVIYICFRTKSLLIFDWIDYFGLTQMVDFIRNKTKYLYDYLPKQIIYSFPAGLWLYSFISFNILIWQRSNNRIKYFWIILPLVISIFSEVLQFFNLINGTYSNLDICFYIFFSILAYYKLGLKNGEK